MPEKKKKSFIDYIFYGFYAAAALAVIAAAVLVGYSLDMTKTDEGEIDGLAALNYVEKVIETPQTAFTYALNEEKSNARRMVLYAVVAIGLFAAYKMTSKKRFHRKGVEHGSAKWGGDKERKILEDSKELYNNIIYADDIYLVLDRKRREANNPKAYKRKKQSAPKQVDDSKKLAIKKDNSAAQKVQAMLNLNAVVIGGTGTGKSRFFVKPNLLQCNTSFVVTDPSGELLQSCGKVLERNGYEVKCFNLMNMEHSSNYNPFAYLKNYKGEFVADNVIKMINTFMVNTKAEGASGGDQFWDDATRLLLSAICFLITETAEKEEEQNFAQVLDLIRMAKVVEGKEEEKSELDFVFEKRKEAAPKALSVQYYDEFKQAAGKTMQSILISTTTKLQHFKLPNLRNLTHKDTIGLETLGDKKTALFIIIPSTDKTYNFLAAMMYMQLFDTLFDRAIQKYGGRLPFHVRFVLDEFANVGKIPDFETVLATMRKFELSATVILQNLAQLKRLYEKSWEEIPGNCDTMLYLGGKDQSTNEYISKELGKETIDTLAVNKTKSRQGSTSYNDGILGRELLTADELAKMENSQCIVMIRGLPPFYTLKYRLERHPRYGQLEECDKANNTFPLDSIITQSESVIVDQTGLEGLVFDFDELIKEQAKIEVIPEGKRRKVEVKTFAGLAGEIVKSISGGVWKKEVLNGKAA